MAMRSALSRFGFTRSTGLSSIGAVRSADCARGATRCFSDDKGRVLSEEERAKENVYIQKWERERLEKLKQKGEKEKVEKEKEKEGGEKKPEDGKP